jgi:hypothetical protein
MEGSNHTFVAARRRITPDGTKDATPTLVSKPGLRTLEPRESRNMKSAAGDTTNCVKNSP